MCELYKLAANVSTIHFWSSQNIARKVHKVFTSDHIETAYVSPLLISLVLFFISDYICCMFSSG